MLDNDPVDRTDEAIDGLENAENATEPVASLTDDISAFFQDGKNYAQAEIQYQKTRMSFVADRGKDGLVFLFGGLALLHLALIGLVIGGIISLATLIGPLGATAIIVAVLLVGMGAMLFLAKVRFSSAASAFKSENDV